MTSSNLTGCELEFDRLHHRKFGWLGTVENAGDVDADLAIGVRDAISVAGQTARRGEFANIANRGHTMASRKDSHLTAPTS